MDADERRRGKIDGDGGETGLERAGR